MENVHSNFTRICRTCKSESAEMWPLFQRSQKFSENPRIDEMLMACTSVQVKSNDGLPTLICKLCSNQLEAAYSFKKQCEATETSLKQYLKAFDVEVKEEYPNAEQMLEDINSMITASNNGDIDNREPGEILKQTIPKSDYIEFLDNNLVLLTCRTCNKIFTTLDGLKCHKRVHTGDLFKCKICDKEYTRLNHLQRHELSHGRRKVHVCKICNKTLTRFEHLKRHLVTHLKEKPFSCEKCNRGFNRLEHLVNHARRCKGDRVHICDICNKGFNREDSLQVHKRIHENKMPVLPTLDNLDNIEEHYFEIDTDAIDFNLDENSDGELDDNDCFEPVVDITENLDLEKVEEVANIGKDDKQEEDEKLELKIKLDDVASSEEHTIEEGTETREEDKLILYDAEDDGFAGDSDSAHSEYFPTPKPSPKIKRGRGRPRKDGSAPKPSRPRGRPPLMKIKKEEADEEEGIYHCAVCEKSFSKLENLEKHFQKHEENKCGICGKEFSRSTHLKRHMASHSEDKPFVCDICTKCFNRRDHLTQHMKLHSREHKFECELCNRFFSRADHLVKHKNMKHNSGEKVIGEKKYKCTVCMKGFTTEKYREVHMRSHTGEKTFQCKTCEKAFISKSHLTEHTKFHNDNSKKFLCSECGQRFIRNDYLVIHMRRHRGEKPFKCKYCGKGFPRTTDLTVHERYHTGEKTHLCTMCGRGFGRAYNLTVHMRTHTGEKPYQCTYCDAAFAQTNDLKAHIRRHTGERFQCELCPETFLMGYLLTQHKRTVHGLNVVSNIRRLQPIHKINPDDPPPITIPLPAPIIPEQIPPLARMPQFQQLKE